MEIKILKSERLLLKPLDMSFLSMTYVNWLNDPEVNKYLESGGDYTIDKLLSYLEFVEKNKIYFWAILINGERHIGNIKVDPINWRNRVGEYGILMGDKNEWGKGYAKEATQTVLKYCFEDLALRKVVLGVVEDNITALNLYKKIGFVIEGQYKKHAWHVNKWCDVNRMALFNPNFNEW